MMASMGLLSVLPAAGGIAGALLAWRGWRGEPIDDHPLCRTCGYDLFGCPSADTCPECGADLASPRSRVVGHRRRRRRSLGAGVVLLLLSLVAAGLLITPALRNYNWNRMKPVWLLLREARTNQSPAQLTELIDRLTASRLSQRQIDHIADEGLAQQKDGSSAWNPLWGDFLVSARSVNRLSDDRWRRYASQALDFAVRPNALRVSARNILSNVLDVSVAYQPTRAAASGVKPLFLQTTIRASGDLLADQQYTSEIEHPLQLFGGVVGQNYHAKLDPRKLAAANTTEQTIAVTVEAIVSDIPDYSLNDTREPGKHPPLVRRTITLTAPWRLVLSATRPTTRP